MTSAQAHAASDPMHELAWLMPGARVNPADALPRIRALCEVHADLFTAMQVVQATHLAVPRPMLAAAFKQYRAEVEALTPADVEGLLASAWNGGREGFDAVMRTRKRRDRKVSASALPWASE